MRTSEPASFWRENAKAVVILLLVSVPVMAETSYKMLFILRSREGLNLSNKDNSANFLVKKSTVKLSEVSTF